MLGISKNCRAEIVKTSHLDFLSAALHVAATSFVVSILNQFGKYLELTGHEACALPSCRWSQHSFTPYIFTRDEIDKQFQAADSIRPIAQARNTHKELSVLFWLLYGCGLRVPEAVGLHCRDVDLKKSILTIREAKNRRDRLIPLSESLRKLLRDYWEETVWWLQDDDFFFPAPDRPILSPNTVYQRFRKLLWASGIPYNGKGNGPRLHDIRHPNVKPKTQNIYLCYNKSRHGNITSAFAIA